MTAIMKTGCLGLLAANSATVLESEVKKNAIDESDSSQGSPAERKNFQVPWRKVEQLASNALSEALSEENDSVNFSNGNQEEMHDKRLDKTPPINRTAKKQTRRMASKAKVIGTLFCCLLGAGYLINQGLPGSSPEHSHGGLFGQPNSLKLSHNLTSICPLRSQNLAAYDQLLLGASNQAGGKANIQSVAEHFENLKTATTKEQVVQELDALRLQGDLLNRRSNQIGQSKQWPYSAKYLTQKSLAFLDAIEQVTEDVRQLKPQKDAGWSLSSITDVALKTIGMGKRGYLSKFPSISHAESLLKEVTTFQDYLTKFPDAAIADLYFLGSESIDPIIQKDGQHF